MAGGRSTNPCVSRRLPKMHEPDPPRGCWARCPPPVGPYWAGSHRDSPSVPTAGAVVWVHREAEGQGLGWGRPRVPMAAKGDDARDVSGTPREEPSPEARSRCTGDVGLTG